MRRCLKRAAVAAVVLGVATIGLAGTNPAGAVVYPHDTATKCNRTYLRLSAGSVLGWIAGAANGSGGVGPTYDLYGFCNPYTLGQDLDADGIPDTNPTYSGIASETIGNSAGGTDTIDRVAQFTAYTDRLDYLRIKVYNDFGSPSPVSEPQRYAEVTKFASNVVGNLDLANWTMGQKLPSRIKAYTAPHNWSWLTGQHDVVFENELRNSALVNIHGTYGPYYKDFNALSPGWIQAQGSGSGNGTGGSNSTAVGIAAAGCLNQLASSQNGFVYTVASGTKYGATWRVGGFSGCGIGGGVATEDGGAGLLLLGGITVEFTASIFNA